MAYQSNYAGSEIDAAVGEVRDRIWKAWDCPINESNGWKKSEGEDSPYYCTIVATTSYTGVSVPPIVWFRGEEDKIIYYCDYTVEVDTSGNKYTIVVKSNSNKNGAFYIMGLNGISELTLNGIEITQ